MSKHRLTEVDLCRVHELHRMGIANTKIALEMNVSERTIRYHLDMPEPEPGPGCEEWWNFTQRRTGAVTRQDYSERAGSPGVSLVAFYWQIY
jgi:hypothetical protein